ncbi:MAG: hypothetical protein ACK4S8_14950 [Alishewanella aestuarii]
MQSLTITDTQRLAEDARRGLRMVAAGEDQTMDGWLVYGHTLQAGRKLFQKNGQGNKAFGEWVSQVQLGSVDHRDQAAALWATDPDHPARFGDTRRLHPRVRTVRGLWAKWNEANRSQQTPKPTFEEPTEAELRRVEMLRNTINHPSTETHLRANAKAKLNDYLERFGQTEEPKPRQQLNMNQLVATCLSVSAEARF